jgi:plasmid rolling circle replication initiator protein Rep
MQILIDTKINKKGIKKDAGWKYKKKLSLYLSESFRRLEQYGKAYRISICGNWLEFKRYEDLSLKLHMADFCRERLCPMCAWRRSRKVFGQVSKIMDYMTEKHDYDYIFLTFTVRNMLGKDLSDALDVLLKAFSDMTRRKEFKKLSKGWFRSLEITHNWGKSDYHPHIHMIVAVNKNYFARGPKTVYMSHKAWMNLWRSCAGLDYDPWVDVRKIRSDDKRGYGSYGGAIAEVAKYTVKGSDYVVDLDKQAKEMGFYGEGGKGFEQVKLWLEGLTDDVVSVLDAALKGRRLISFGGKLKEVHKLLNLADPVEGDLVNTDGDDDMREDLKYIIERYNWHVGYGDYVLDEIIMDVTGK